MMERHEFVSKKAADGMMWMKISGGAGVSPA
jgi:hypothetical protein